jgi:hypothetical protein
MHRLEDAETLLSRARRSVESELWQLEAEVQRRLRDGGCVAEVVVAAVKWQRHMVSITEAEAMLAEARHGPLAEQAPICEVIIQNLKCIPAEPVTRH